MIAVNTKVVAPKSGSRLFFRSAQRLSVIILTGIITVAVNYKAFVVLTLEVLSPAINLPPQTNATKGSSLALNVCNKPNVSKTARIVRGLVESRHTHQSSSPEHSYSSRTSTIQTPTRTSPDHNNRTVQDPALCLQGPSRSNLLWLLLR